MSTQSMDDTRGDQFGDGDAGGRGLNRQIKLRELWPPIYRSRFVVMAIMALALALAIGATLLISPIYRAASTVEIKQDTQKVLGTEDEADQGLSAGDIDLFLQTQLDIIGSRSTTSAVAETRGLYDDSSFLVAMGVDPDTPGSALLSAEENRRDLVNTTLLDNLSVAFSEDTRIAQIRFDSPDARLAAQIANSYAENYIRLNLARRFDASRYSLDFLRDQLAQSLLRLTQSEREALAYARRSGLVDASNAAVTGTGSAPRSLTVASAVQLNDELSRATADRISAEQKWATVRAAPLLGVPEVMSNLAIQDLVGERAKLQGQYSEQLNYRSAEHPLVQQAAARIAALDRQIGQVAGNVRAGIRNGYDVAQAREGALRRQVETLKGTSLDEQNRGIQLSILQREANTNRQQYDSLLGRFNELNAQAGVQTNNLAIIDRAEIPVNPIWPSIVLNIALALIVGSALSGAYIIGRENLFDMVRTPDDVTDRLGLPILGVVPPTPDLAQALRDPKSHVSEAFSSIRTGLALSSAAGIPSSMVFTSTQASEGKSTMCVGLAIGLAKIGKRVVIIDADLRRPNVHRLAGLANDAGLSNALSSDDATLALVQQSDLGIDVMTAGPVPPNPAELLATDRLAALVARLGDSYDHVLVDSAPLMGLADAALVAKTGQGVIFVIESARTSVRAASTAVARLDRSGVPVLGVVISRFDPGREGYGFDDRLNYDYSYGST